MKRSPSDDLEAGVAMLDTFMQRLGPLSEAQRERISLWLRERARPIIEQRCDELRKPGMSDAHLMQAETAVGNALEIIFRDRLTLVQLPDTYH